MLQWLNPAKLTLNQVPTGDAYLRTFEMSPRPRVIILVLVM